MNRSTLAVLIASSVIAVPQLLGQTWPGQSGAYGVGFTAFKDDSIPGAVWYPIPAGSEGDPIAYTHGGYPYESPFLGVLTDFQPARTEQYPLIVLSHGWGAWPIQFAHLAESLASHGHVVAAPQHSTNTVDPRATELTRSVQIIRERSAMPGDLLEGIVDTEKLIVGGYSHGAVTTATSLRQGEYDADGILLIDGSGQSWTLDSNTTPVLHLGGGDLSGSTAASRTKTARFIGSDLFGANPELDIHHWSFGMNGCQFRGKIEEAGASPKEAETATAPDSFWLGCNEALVNPEVVQRRMNEYAVSFASEVFDGTEIDFGLPHRLSIGKITLTASIDTEDRTQGLSVLLSDPQGRAFGTDPQTGELISDFSGGTFGRPERIRPEIRFGILKKELSSGEYTLTATTDALAETANYSIYLETEIKDGEDRVAVRREIANGVAQRGEPIAPVQFDLQVSPLNDCDFDGVTDVADLNCTRIRDSEAVFAELGILPGDLDGDGRVSFVDFLTLSGNFGELGDYGSGNVNFRGRIDMADFLILSGNFGKTRTNVEIVPEPTLDALLILFILIRLVPTGPRQ